MFDTEFFNRNYKIIENDGEVEAPTSKELIPCLVNPYQETPEAFEVAFLDLVESFAKVFNYQYEADNQPNKGGFHELVSKCFMKWVEWHIQPDSPLAVLPKAGGSLNKALSKFWAAIEKNGFVISLMFCPKINDKKTWYRVIIPSGGDADCRETYNPLNRPNFVFQVGQNTWALASNKRPGPSKLAQEILGYQLPAPRQDFDDEIPF